MEPTGHYWKPLASWLKQRGFTVVTVNPMLVKRHKEDLDNAPSKSDPKDAAVIADLVWQRTFLNVSLPQGVYAELRELQVTRQQPRSKWTRGSHLRWTLGNRGCGYAGAVDSDG